MLNQPRVRYALVGVVAIMLLGAVTAAVRSQSAPSATPITITSPSAMSGTPALSTGSGSAPVGAADTNSAAVGGSIYVHITGAVRTPNMYQLPDGSRLSDAIKLAGGAKESADLNAVNLAEKLQDGEKIYVPTHEDTKAIPPMTDAAPQNAIGDQPAATIASSTTPESAMGSTTGTGASGGKGKKAEKPTSNKLKDPAQGTININKAPVTQLMRLPGVGKKTAEKIIEYRTTTGLFKSPEEIMNVAGIGQKKFDKMKAFIRVD